MSLSLCSFVKNEERHIEAMIRSVIDIVDEVNILDTGSFDNTLSIIENLSCEYKDIPFNIECCEFTNFADIRYKTKQMSTKDWVLMLDGDEEIFSFDHDKLKVLMLDKEIECWLLPRRNWTEMAYDVFRFGEKIDQIYDKYYLNNQQYFYVYPDWQARLFINSDSIKWENPVHESLVGAKLGYAADGPHIEHLHLVVKTWLERHNAYEFYKKLSQE